MDARLEAISKKRKSWKNIIRNQQVDPLRYFEPENIMDLIDIIKDAEDHKFRVRAVGSGFLFSDVALTSGYMVHPGKMDKVSEAAEVRLKKDALSKRDSDKTWVEIEAGITIYDLNRKLDKMGYALSNMGAVDNQTFSGAASTGTHGTGVELHGLPGMIKSMLVVSSGGKVRRIEPADGITDPATFVEQNKNLNHDVELVQEDDCFNSCLINLGCMGITHSYIIEVEELYWLCETKKLMNWQEVKAKLIEGLEEGDAPKLEGEDKRKLDEKIWFKENKRFSVQINPYEVKKQHDCVLITYEKLPGKPKHRSLPDRLRNVLTIFGGIPSFPDCI